MADLLKIAICDDASADRHCIETLTQTWAEQHHISLCKRIFSSAESFLFAYESEKDFDILLLDVEMEGMNGVSLAQKIRKENETVQIIFITGYSDYIAEGYDVAALHYLLKPIHTDKLFSVLDRALQKCNTNERTLTIASSGEVIRVPLYQIRYAEVQLNYVTIYAKESITVKMTLSELLSMLDKRFYRIGRSFLVNLTEISRVTKKAIFLRDETILPIPRGAYEGINRAIIQME